MSDFMAWLITAAVIAVIFSIETILDRIRRSRLSAADRELLERAMRAIPASGPRPSSAARSRDVRTARRPA
jgi:hypothetical protein